MHALVTGAAGFIGSTLADRLLDLGWRVRGVDRFTAYYEEAQKRANLRSATERADFELVEADLQTTALDPLLDGIDVVFHLAGQPGVRLSWADGFGTYVDLNIKVTQRLLEAARQRGLQRFVYASSSSVYGNAPTPTTESSPTEPFSPYGVTKLAGELLTSSYAANFGVPTVSLRYFTVYGPRQRPDMAIYRMIEGCLTGQAFPLYGDGSQVRDFTFVDDVVAATIAAATTTTTPGTVINVAGGSSTTVRDLIALVERATGSELPLDRHEAQAGDVSRTGASIERASELLGWAPTVNLADGVERQVAWHRSR